jgi:hypothetical protein
MAKMFSVPVMELFDFRGEHLGPSNGGTSGGSSPGLALHDLRRTCAKLCRAAGGELEQI